jgi:hypothetical protein
MVRPFGAPVDRGAQVGDEGAAPLPLRGEGMGVGATPRSRPPWFRP